MRRTILITAVILLAAAARLGAQEQWGVNLGVTPAWQTGPGIDAQTVAARELLDLALGRAAIEGEAAARLAREKQEAAAREVALEAERKAARDARYAARKKKKR